MSPNGSIATVLPSPSRRNADCPNHSTRMLLLFSRDGPDIAADRVAQAPAPAGILGAVLAARRRLLARARCPLAVGVRCLALTRPHAAVTAVRLLAVAVLAAA